MQNIYVVMETAENTEEGIVEYIDTCIRPDKAFLNFQRALDHRDALNIIKIREALFKDMAEDVYSIIDKETALRITEVHNLPHPFNWSDLSINQFSTLNETQKNELAKLISGVSFYKIYAVPCDLQSVSEESKFSIENYQRFKNLNI
jgi:hypothetical protein